MSNIKPDNEWAYTFRVVHSDPSGMVLRFSSEGFPDLDWGCRLPYLGETVEDVARQYDPRAAWREQYRERVIPVIGTEGLVVPEAPPQLTPEEIFRANVQARLDAFAATRGYDGILSACSYATSTNERFRREGQRAVELRDATWATGYQLLAEIQAGTRQMPSSFSEVEPLLPALTWE